MSRNTLSRYSHSHSSKSINYKDIDKRINASLKELHDMKLRNQKGINQLQEMKVELADLKDKCKQMKDAINSRLEFKRSIREFLNNEANFTKLDVSDEVIEKMQHELNVIFTLAGLNPERKYTDEKDYKMHDGFVNFYRRYYLLPYIIQKLEADPTAFPWSIVDCREFYEATKAKIHVLTEEDYKQYEKIKIIKQMQQTLAESHLEATENINRLKQLVSESTQNLSLSHEELKQEIDNLLHRFKP